MPIWADQPAEGRYRLAGALAERSPALVVVYPHGDGRVTVECPYLLNQGAYNWPGHDFGGRPTGTYPPTRAAAIRVVDALRAQGPDTVRTWLLVWRWERWDAPGLHPGQWVLVDPRPAAVRLHHLAANIGRPQHERRAR